MARKIDLIPAKAVENRDGAAIKMPAVFPHASALPPAVFFHEFSAFPSAASTAFRIPVELNVAPDTVSTSVL